MKCDVCSANVIELRRGRCWGCYNRWVENRPVGLGARCCICGERRHDFLRTSELLGGWWPTCYSCSGRIHGLEIIPPSIAEIRIALDRERRGKQSDRRCEEPDSRVFLYERRRDDRRQDASERTPRWPPLHDALHDPACALPDSPLLDSQGGGGDSSDDGDGDDERAATRVAEGTDPRLEVSLDGQPPTQDDTAPPLTVHAPARAGEIDDLALSEIALEIAQTGDYDPDLTCIRDLGWSEHVAASQTDDRLDGSPDLLDL